DLRDREVVREVAYGRADRALEILARKGDLIVSDDRAISIARLVAEWSASETPVESRLIFAPTRAEARLVNRLCQAARGDELGAERVEAAACRVHVGDRVMLTRNCRKLGVRNGDMGEVVAAKDSLLTVRLDGGDRVTIDVSSYEHIELGYSATVHKTMGDTVEEAFTLLGGSMQDRELSYTQLTRARGRVRAYADRVTGGGELERLVS